jgi:hypothetical protein
MVSARPIFIHAALPGLFLQRASSVATKIALAELGPLKPVVRRVLTATAPFAGTTDRVKATGSSWGDNHGGTH